MCSARPSTLLRCPHHGNSKFTGTDRVVQRACTRELASWDSPLISALTHTPRSPPPYLKKPHSLFTCEEITVNL